MRADRLLSLVMLLQTRGKLTTQTLARELEVSRRTILRDVDALSSAGIPIYTEGGHGGGIALDENYRLSLTGLKETEVRALFVSGLSSILSDIGLNKTAENSLLKLFTALPSLHQRSVEDFRQRIHIDPVWWWHEMNQTPFWDDLQRAVYESIGIEAAYEDFNGVIAERVLEPYSLVSKAGIWYLVAQRAGEFRVYRVSRFRQIRLIDQHFERDPAFDLAAFWRDHTREMQATIPRYTCTLRVSESGEMFLKWFMPGTAELIALDEADGWRTFQVRVPAEDSARMLVFGLGAQARVIDPPELRESVRATAREILEISG